ncbi:AAA family ATPase [Nakamurella lactea]|uniref:AAA family ATPase n=1 Tax=Nakamurella lactea TaxID=459515 RepID=UPI00041A3A94|nr:MoxR family ATPase [Nakamurella lactea]
MTEPMTDTGVAFESPDAVERALSGTGYLPDPALATAVFLAARLQRPLLLEGEAGVGKTSLAEALAQIKGSTLIRLQCYEGIDASQALYDWDFPRQVLHLRAVQALRTDTDTTPEEVAAVEDELYSERFLLARPVLAALRTPDAVLLIDEIDRADDEFEAFLLEVLADYAVTIPELGRVVAQQPPMVVITSNRTREVHDALKRRCLYHWLEHPTLVREVQILRRRLPGIDEQLAADVAGASARLRGAALLKPPGVAESLDWARALTAIGVTRLDERSGLATIGAALKYREDIEVVRASGALLTGSA